MQRAERAAHRRAWREAVQLVKASEANIDRANYEVIREMRAAGLSGPALGQELGQRNWTALYQRYQRLERRFGQARPDSKEPPTTPSRDG